MNCEECGTSNGYPKLKEKVWQCRKCLHKTPIKEEEEVDDE